MEVYRPAGFWNRVGARLIDGIIITVVIGLITLLIYGSFFTDGYTFLDFLGYAYLIIVPVVWYGYTIGRKIAGNRIVRMDGRKVGFGTMLLREVVSTIVYVITLGFGAIASLFMIGVRDDKRAIHDFIAKTYVTHAPPEQKENEAAAK
ncbi:RDD family protein [Halobacillus sp. A5]|uniref:RDD family protein n=1 Tax=Halobacillus sp. A5 TaxID=2880263 RepID=UPI0020A6C5F4|nr:RDD family protein [Halobacillus sp. A5]MCP3027134.1 RDD family protein [Halobacillus sp. A5]